MIAQNKYLFLAAGVFMALVTVGAIVLDRWCAANFAAKFVHTSQDGKGEIRLAEKNPWQDLVDAFNVNFEKVSNLTCAGPVTHRYVVGDILTAQNLTENFAPIIQAIEEERCLTRKHAQ